ncbi:MAG TPA: GNAT family N-acetyltransferase [Gemmatimonadaceae bacterium]|nr:GNAT family N-acetyltransferase [Gemmatimonadaceae bacterium]
MSETPGRVVVTPARPADVDRVAPLFDAYRQFYGAAPDLGAARAFLSERLARGESVVLIAAVEPPHGEGEIVAAGFTQLYPSFSSLALAPTVVLNDLFVAPERRGMGVARRLIEAVVAHARSTGAVRIELATQHTNSRALRLYERLGFVRDTEFVHLSVAVTSRTDVAGSREAPTKTTDDR